MCVCVRCARLLPIGIFAWTRAHRERYRFSTVFRFCHAISRSVAATTMCASPKATNELNAGTLTMARREKGEQKKKKKTTKKNKRKSTIDNAVYIAWISWVLCHYSMGYVLCVCVLATFISFLYRFWYSLPASTAHVYLFWARSIQCNLNMIFKLYSFFFSSLEFILCFVLVYLLFTEFRTFRYIRKHTIMLPNGTK